MSFTVIMGTFCAADQPHRWTSNHSEGRPQSGKDFNTMLLLPQVFVFLRLRQALLLLDDFSAAKAVVAYMF